MGNNERFFFWAIFRENGRGRIIFHVTFWKKMQFFGRKAVRDRNITKQKALEERFLATIHSKNYDIPIRTTD